MVAASWLRWHADSIGSTPAKTRARLGSSASNAPAAARLSSTRLLIARGLTRRGEIGEIDVNSPLAARLDDQLDRLRADALERGQRVERSCRRSTSKSRPSG